MCTKFESDWYEIWDRAEKLFDAHTAHIWNSNVYETSINRLSVIGTRRECVSLIASVLSEKPKDLTLSISKITSL